MVSDTKPTKTKPTKTKPTKPTKPLPSKARAAKTPPNKAKANQAARAKPVASQPTKTTKTRPAKAVKAQPTKAKATQTPPAKASAGGPIKALSSKTRATGPIKALPIKALPIKALPIKAGPIKAAKTGPIMPPPAKAAPTRSAKAQAPKTLPAQANKAKATKAKATKVARTSTNKEPRPLPDVHALAVRLRAAIPKPESELAFSTPFGLLTATILAAQSTDKVVNQVMPTLLARYPTARELAASEQADVEQLIVRTGFFRNKAKAIRGMAQKLVADHGGEVPRTIEQMVELPGVARKTANVVLGTAFGIGSGFIVDTHVARVSLRLGLSEQTDPVRIEQDLCSLFCQTEWIDMAHRLTLHGRYTCLAKAPQCSVCPLNELCTSRIRPADHAWPARAEAENVRTEAGLRASRGY